MFLPPLQCTTHFTVDKIVLFSTLLNCTLYITLYCTLYCKLNEYFTIDYSVQQDFSSWQTSMNGQNIWSISVRWHRTAISRVFVLALGPQNWLIPSAAIWDNVDENNGWGVWPYCQIINKFCWLVWVSKSGKNIGPKFVLPNLVFGQWCFFVEKTSHQNLNSNFFLFCKIVEKRFKSFSQRYC